MSEQVDVGFTLPAEIGNKLVRIEGVDKVLVAIVDYMDKRITTQSVLDVFDSLTRTISLPGYNAVQIGQSIFAAEDE